MSAEEQKAASPEAAPAVGPSTTNGEQAAAEKPADEGANGSDEKMELDAPAPAEKEEPKAEEQKEEKQEEAADAPAEKESKPASTSSRQTRPKPESAKPPSSKPAAAAGGAKKVARPRNSLPAGKGKTGSGADGANKSFSPGDIVLARLKGYPPWPARVTAHDDLPGNVMDARPSQSPLLHCVQFFPAGDYSWLNVRDLTTLSTSDIDSWLEITHRKAAGRLREAYETAKDPSEWDANQADRAAQQVDEEDAEMDVDELEDEEGEETGGKRKKSAAPKKAGAKKAKTEKKAKPEPEAKKPKAAAKKADKPESQAAAAAEQAGDEDPLASDPICVKVKGWRHALQRAFLGKELPSAEEMLAHDETFKKIETFDDMTIQALQYSKIGKVMKKISTLEGIPRDDELHIRERAAKLMNDWHAFIEKEQGAEGQANGDKE